MWRIPAPAPGWTEAGACTRQEGRQARSAHVAADTSATLGALGGDRMWCIVTALLRCHNMEQAGRWRSWFPSTIRTTQGTPLSSKLQVGGRFKSEHGSRCGASPEHIDRKATHVHIASASKATFDLGLPCWAMQRPPTKGPWPLGGWAPWSCPWFARPTNFTAAKGSGVDVLPQRLGEGRVERVSVTLRASAARAC